MSGRTRVPALPFSVRGPTSPFWTGFSVTLTETFGATVLALPIAVAGPGPIPGLVALIVLGVINMFTLAAFVEAFSRDGGVPSGRVFLGRLVESYLGKPVSIAIRVLLVALLMLVLSAYYIGVGTTVGDELPVSPVLVAALMFVAGLVFLSQDSLGSVVSASIVVGAVNVVLILTIVALSLGKLHPAYLTFADTPFYGGHHFYLRVVGLLVGVVLSAYFGHLAVATCAPTVLRRDPSGRTLLWGCVAAEGTIMALYILWVIAVNGVVPRRALMDATSTAIVPLASVVGAGVRVLGLAFVVLAMGMASVHISIGLRDTVREWLPLGGRSRWNPERARALFSILPVVVVFLVTEWFLWRGVFSFSALIAYIGIAVVSIVGGFLPLFLLAASRGKGDRSPGTVVGFLGNRVLLATLYVIFLGIILVHGIFIWTNPEERITAVLLAVFVTAMSAWILRTGALKPRLSVEVRTDALGQEAQVSAMSRGRPLDAEWTLWYEGAPATSLSTANAVINVTSLNAIECAAPSAGIAQMQIWVHADTAEGNSQPVPAIIELLQSDAVRRLVVEERSGVCLIPLDAEQVRARISFSARLVTPAPTP